MRWLARTRVRVARQTIMTLRIAETPPRLFSPVVPPCTEFNKRARSSTSDITRHAGPFSNIFPYDKSVSNDRENNDIYVPTPDIAESSPRGHPDLRRGFPNPPHAGEARWNPNCSAEAENIVK